MDFERRCVEIAPADAVRRYRGWGRVTGELRFGHLVVIPGRIGRAHVNVLIDTGSDSSLANVALRDVLGSARALPADSALRAYTAGRPIILETAIGIPALKIGDVEIRNIAAYVGDYHIFGLWGLQEEPTLLLGMDVLSTARAMSIDYRRATVHIRFRSRARP